MIQISNGVRVHKLADHHCKSSCSANFSFSFLPGFIFSLFCFLFFVFSFLFSLFVFSLFFFLVVQCWNVFPRSVLDPKAADLLNYWTIKYFTLNKTNWKTFPCFMRNFPCGRKPDVSINYHRKRGKRERVFFDFPLLASQDIAKTNF